MAIKVEDGIPLPQRRTSELRSALETMSVGQSFAFPVKSEGSVRSHTHLLKSAKSLKFAIRRVSDTTARVWRVG